MFVINAKENKQCREEDVDLLRGVSDILHRVARKGLLRECLLWSCRKEMVSAKVLRQEDITYTSITHLRTWSPVWLEQSEQRSKGSLGRGQGREARDKGGQRGLRTAWQVTVSILAFTLRCIGGRINRPSPCIKVDINLLQH